MGGEIPLLYQGVHHPQEIPGGEGDTGDGTHDGTDAGMGDICTVTVSPGSEVTLRYTVSQACHLRWKFKSEGGDIGFGVKRKEAVKNVDEAVYVEDPEAATEDIVKSKRV